MFSLSLCRLSLARSHAEEMESTLNNAGVKLKKIEDEYRRRMEEEINKNKEIVAQINQLNTKMDNKGKEILQEQKEMDFVMSARFMLVHRVALSESG